MSQVLATLFRFRVPSTKVLAAAVSPRRAQTNSRKQTNNIENMAWDDRVFANIPIRYTFPPPESAIVWWRGVEDRGKRDGREASNGGRGNIKSLFPSPLYFAMQHPFVSLSGWRSSSHCTTRAHTSLRDLGTLRAVLREIGEKVDPPARFLPF